MSLYDDIILPGSNDSAPIPVENETIPKPQTHSFLFLKQQLDARKAQTTLIKSKPKPAFTPISTVISSGLKSTVSSTTSAPKPINVLKPRRAKPLPLDAPSTFSIIPKAIKEDKVYLFNEIQIEDEYNPTNPTDYMTYKAKREAQLIKEKIAKDIAYRLAREHDEEEAKRKTGAAFAPPKLLIEQDSVVMAEPEPTPPPINLRGVKRGLNVAAGIMSKMGYKEGQGLGKDEQGMSTALRVEKIGRRAGVIVEGDKKSWDRDSQDVTQNYTVDITELTKTASKVVLIKVNLVMLSNSNLQNMVTPEEVDETLKEEVFDEMKKYGQVIDVVVHTVLEGDEKDTVRIFVEFTNQGQAMKSVIDLNKRFFGGRAVQAQFFDLALYSNRDFEQ